jgi:hypothetical protein
MIIHEFYYNEHNEVLYVEFSTKEDGDSVYRVLELEFRDVQYYSPNIIIEEDLHDIDEDFVVDIIEQYLLDNDLPEEISL